MNIKKYSKIKEKLESKIDVYTEEVEERWQKLTGFGCGYFDGWNLDERESMIFVSYSSLRSGHETDRIPIRFFEIDNDDEAVKEFQAFSKQKEKEANLKMIAEKRESRWEEYKRLKKEFEPNENILPKDSSSS